MADVDILNMDPIPCPSHLFKHVWPEGGAPALEVEDTKKYLNQVRNSRGYDVDCSPHPNLVYQAFRKSDIDEKSKVKLESTVIPHIQLKQSTGKNSKVVENDDSAAAETFTTTLSIPSWSACSSLMAMLPARISIQILKLNRSEYQTLYMRSTNYPHTPNYGLLFLVALKII